MVWSGGVALKGAKPGLLLVWCLAWPGVVPYKELPMNKANPFGKSPPAKDGKGKAPPEPKGKGKFTPFKKK